MTSEIKSPQHPLCLIPALPLVVLNQVDGITKDVSLMVTDFSENDEVEETKMLWDNQISDLKKVLGSS